MILSIARREVITANCDDTLKHVAGLMEYYNVGCVVITHNEKPIGIVTDRDLAMYALASHTGGEHPGLTKVEVVMTLSPKTVHEDEGFDKAVELMQEWGVRRLPVVDRQGKLRGLVTLDDMAVAMANNARLLAEMLKRQAQPPAPTLVTATQPEEAIGE